MRRVERWRQSEKAEQEDIKKFFRRLNCFVVSFSQTRRTRQTQGIPDLKVFHKKGAFWFEVKRVGWAKDGERMLDEQRPNQKIFQDWCEKTGELYFLGAMEEALDALKGIRALKSH